MPRTAVVWNFAANEGCYIVEDGIMLMDVPSFEFCKPRKLSKLMAPTRQGGPCPGFTIQEIDGSPKIPCPYGIIRMGCSIVVVVAVYTITQEIPSIIPTKIPSIMPR